MKKNDVKLNQVYSVKVSGTLARVKLTAENPRGGWDGTNLATGRTVRIKTAARLRGPAPERPKTGGKRIVTLAQHEAELAEADGTVFEDTERDTGQRGGDTGHPLSLIEAALKVLGEADEPLGCREMVERATDAGYWTPARGGKTPDRTLASAILRELKLKGDDSRFEKVARGRYARRDVG